MAEKIFTEEFCEIQKKSVCTTTDELNFDNYTECGTYQIYEDMGNGQNRTYFLEVDKSATGGCVTQTRLHCGKLEYRYKDADGVWCDWYGAGSSSDLGQIALDAANAADKKITNHMNTNTVHITIEERGIWNSGKDAAFKARDDVAALQSEVGLVSEALAAILEMDAKLLGSEEA